MSVFCFVTVPLDSNELFMVKNFTESRYLVIKNEIHMNALFLLFVCVEFCFLHPNTLYKIKTIDTIVGRRQAKAGNLMLSPFHAFILFHFV